MHANRYLRPLTSHDGGPICPTMRVIHLILYFPPSKYLLLNHITDPINTNDYLINSDFKNVNELRLLPSTFNTQRNECKNLLYYL